jgi:hypothetical protein
MEITTRYHTIEIQDKGILHPLIEFHHREESIVIPPDYTFYILGVRTIDFVDPPEPIRHIFQIFKQPYGEDLANVGDNTSFFDEYLCKDMLKMNGLSSCIEGFTEAGLVR